MFAGRVAQPDSRDNSPSGSERGGKSVENESTDDANTRLNRRHTFLKTIELSTSDLKVLPSPSVTPGGPNLLPEI